MRYCINCGSPMGDERFCNQCGADNGAPMEDSAARNKNATTVKVPTMDLSLIVHSISMVLFVIAAIIMLTVCCKQAQNMTVQSMLYTGTAIFASVYFVIGMWSCIPALHFLMNFKQNKSTSIVGVAIVIIIITIVLCLINIIFSKITGFMKYFSLMAGVYKSKAITIIILEILTILSGLIVPKMKK